MTNCRTMPRLARSAMHPPGEHLHLASLAHTTASAAMPAWRLLLTLANGMRLPYMIVTGCGWGTFAFNIPMQAGCGGGGVVYCSAALGCQCCVMPSRTKALHDLFMAVCQVPHSTALCRQAPASSSPCLSTKNCSLRWWGGPSRTTRPSARPPSSRRPR